MIICISVLFNLVPSYALDGTRQSSFKYKKYTEHEKYHEALFWKMKSVYKTLSDKLDDERTLPIPGLVETYSQSKGKGTMSDQFVPQGICRADKYWLLTAYDADKRCNTVVYVVDPEHNKLVSTIALPNRYHAGGIAFDGENIWLTGDTSDSYNGDPFVQYIKYEDFAHMTDKPLYIVKKDEISDPIYIKNTPSFLEYDSGTLWVGTYVGRYNTKEAYMYGYKVMQTDGPVKLNTILHTVISGLDSSAQGADIVGDEIYVSSSYKGSSFGVKTSFVTKYNIEPLRKGQQNISVASRERSRIEVPKMNEELLVENNKVFINFESASEPWKNAVIMTDRILSIKQSLWD